MSYGVRQGPQGIGWEVYEGLPEGGLTLAQAVNWGSLLAGWDREWLATSDWPYWKSLPVAGTVGEGGGVEAQP